MVPQKNKMTEGCLKRNVFIVLSKHINATEKSPVVDPLYLVHLYLPLPAHPHQIALVYQGLCPLLPPLIASPTINNNHFICTVNIITISFNCSDFEITG